MAPYAVAHFKLGLALAARDEPELWRQRWSYEPRKDERINIFLTNTLEDLEETAQQLGPLRMLSNEANAAYEIKRNKPVLVILGNPPYSGHSANKGKWINGLIDDYLKIDGEKIRERNMKWVRDDYKKFVRWAQWRITATGQGVLGFITNNGYLSDVTMRGMRRSLMQSFDEIYILDLHGNTNKGEVDPETGAADKNVFDIKQGVAIALFVKRPARKGTRKECVVRHADLFSAQQNAKYKWLDSHNIGSTGWSRLNPAAPNYFFFERDTALAAEYEKGRRITEIFGGIRPEESQGRRWGLGIITHNDGLLVDFDREDLTKRFELLASGKPDSEIEKSLKLFETKYWNNARERQKVRDYSWRTFIRQYLYRPFDRRWIVYQPNLMEIGRGGASKGVMHHVLSGPNLALLTTRQTSDPFGVLSTEGPCAHKSLSAYDGTYVFPLYLYPDSKRVDDDLFAQDDSGEESRRPNLSVEFLEDLCARLKVKFIPEGLGTPGKREVGPALIFDYAYAVFHSPTYRARYAEFLRTDFPRLALTKNYDLFRELAGLGGRLVDLHARDQADGSGIAFPIKGNNVVEKVRYEAPQTTGKERHGGRVWINDQQFFEGVAPSVWAVAVGGYLPAQRWLKDRSGRTLSYEDKEAYPRNIAALGETSRLMEEVDAAITRQGGWSQAFAD